ncbi:MAG: dynamin family protein [Gammaproteobacteria bacterium]
MDISHEQKDQVLNLVSKIISPVREDANSTLVKAVDKLDVFVRDKLMAVLNCASPDNSSELVDAFQLSLERFEEFTLFPAFESKQLIGVGGAFSSGKSKLLNTIIGENLLPINIAPSTVVPTFIIHSPQEEVGVINIFNVRNRMSIKDFASISYEFTDEHHIEIRHLIKRAFISSSKMAFENLTLLDTPGYSKADSNCYSERTDEAVAMEQLRTTDYVIWVMDIENGTLKQADIEFLQKLILNKPILMVLSKAEKLNPEEVENVRQEVTESLFSIGIKADDVIPFSAADDSPYPVDPILEWLKKKNTPKAKSSIPIHFKHMFYNYHQYYYQELSDANRRLGNAKRVATVVEPDKDTAELLNAIILEAKNHRNKFQGLKTELSAYQKEFFGMIKDIGSLVGIELPEPDEIDMLTNDTLDLRTLLREFCKNKGIKSSSTDEYILNAMSEEHRLQGDVVNWYQSSASNFNDRWDLSEINNLKLNDLHQAFLAYSNTKVPNFSDTMNKALTVKTVKLEV